MFWFWPTIIAESWWSRSVIDGGTNGSVCWEALDKPLQGRCSTR